MFVFVEFDPVFGAIVMGCGGSKEADGVGYVRVVRWRAPVDKFS